MKLELERQDFLKAWQTAGKFANSKTPKESAGGILITAAEDNSVILEATDLKTSIRCRAQGANVLEAGFAVVPASMLGDMLRKLEANDLILEVNSERGLLNAGSNKMRFSVISADEFPKIPESSGAETVCEVPASILGKIIAEGSSASSQPQDFPKYLGTCLLRTGQGAIMAVSTDGKRLSLSKYPCETTKEEDLLIPAPALKELGKTITSNYGGENSVKILSDGSTVWFALNDIEFSIRRVESAFPKFERILNDELKTTLRIQSGELSSALDRIDIIAKTTPAHIMAMSLNPSDGEVIITARAPELGTASERLQANIEGEYLQLGFNVAFFQDGLKALGAGGALIEFSGEEGQTRMKRSEGDDFLYMLMPARLTSQDTITDEEMGDFRVNSETQELTEIQEVQENQDNQEYQDNQQNQENQENPF